MKPVHTHNSNKTFHDVCFIDGLVKKKNDMGDFLTLHNKKNDVSQKKENEIKHALMKNK